MRKHIITKADILLAAVLVLLCAAACWYVWTEGSRGTYIEVSVNGERYGTYPLDRDEEISIDSEYGHNTLTIRDGKALMTEASCPDGYCLSQHRSEGGIDASNQTIICLPNRVSVTVRAEESDTQRDERENDAPDAVVGTADGAAGYTGEEAAEDPAGTADRAADDPAGGTEDSTSEGGEKR